MKVRLIARTTGVEDTEYENKSGDEITVGIARISSDRTIDNLFDEPEKLLKHCLINGHYSVFTMTNLVFEIQTSRAIGRELLRHWSLKPQEVSQRYKAPVEFEDIELRSQATKNRQSSISVMDDIYLNNDVNTLLKQIKLVFNRLLKNGVSRETARFILPETTQTTLIFNGTIREWITTLNQRMYKASQKEIRLIAEAISKIIIKEYPIVSSILHNFEGAYDMPILDRTVLEKYGLYEDYVNKNSV